MDGKNVFTLTKEKFLNATSYTKCKILNVT